MFGLGGMGMMGGNKPWGMMGQMGQQLMQRGRPQMVGGGQGVPSNLSYMTEGAWRNRNNPLAMGGMLPMGMMGMMPQQVMDKLPPQVLEKLQGLLGPQSQAGWGLGTTTTPAAIPPWLQGLFSRFGGR